MSYIVRFVIVGLLGFFAVMMPPDAARAQGAAPQAVPTVVFPEKDGTYTLSVRDAKFGKDGKSTKSKMTEDPPKGSVALISVALIFDGLHLLPVCVSRPNPAPPCPPGPRVDLPAFDDLKFSGIPASYAGERKFHVQVGEETSQPVSVVLSTVDWWTPYIVTAALLVLLGLLVFGVLSKGQPKRLTSGSSVGLAKMMLIDAKTATYSLSKLQIYVWGAAVLVGYIYLCVARSLVQGVWTLADVPTNLSGILLISIGTSVVSTGLSKAGVDKGTGEAEPMLSDLITSGGVVAPERLQQLIWTVLGGIAFVFYTVSISPAAIEALPTIPAGFLQLMGASAAGYLGGKIARGAGPVLTGATAVLDPAAAPPHGKTGIGRYGPEHQQRDIPAREIAQRDR